MAGMVVTTRSCDAPAHDSRAPTVVTGVRGNLLPLKEGEQETSIEGGPRPRGSTLLDGSPLI